MLNPDSKKHDCSRVGSVYRTITTKTPELYDNIYAYQSSLKPLKAKISVSTGLLRPAAYNLLNKLYKTLRKNTMFLAT